MSRLRRFNLMYDKDKNDWALREEGASRTRKRFQRKSEATKSGVLVDELGKQGGSVRIRKQDGTIQEERTYPGSKDPRKTPG